MISIIKSMSLLSKAFGRILQIRIRGSISQKLYLLSDNRTKTINDGLQRKTYLPIKAIFLTISSMKGSLTQAKNICDMLNIYKHEKQAKVYCFVEDQCFGVAGLLAANADFCYANQMAWMGGFGFVWNNVGLQEWNTRYGIKEEKVAANELLPKYKYFQPITPETEAFTRNQIDILSKQLREEVLKARKQHILKICSGSQNWQTIQKAINEEIFNKPAVPPETMVKYGLIDGIKNSWDMYYWKYSAMINNSPMLRSAALVDQIEWSFSSMERNMLRGSIIFRILYHCLMSKSERSSHGRKCWIFCQQIYHERIQIIKYIEMDDDHEMFKIVVIGSSGTGKTNISTRYIKNQFNESQKATVGVEFLSKIVKVHNQSIKITLWDTAGQQKYKSLSKVYYKGSSGVLIVYDVTDPQSYLDVESWMRLANENLNLNEVVLMVVGNKVDLEEERKVPTERPIRQYKQKFDIDCWEVSAKTGYNVKQVFSELIEKIYQMHMGPKDSHIPFGESVTGDSVIGPESLVVGKGEDPNRLTSSNGRVSKQIPEVILEEEPAIDMIKKKKQQNEAPKATGKVTAPKTDGKATTKKEKDNMKLTVNEDQKRKKEKKEKGGCC